MGFGQWLPIRCHLKAKVTPQGQPVGLQRTGSSEAGPASAEHHGHTVEGRMGMNMGTSHQLT